jgi:DNA-binding MarR family transcriptional regulator
MNAQRILDARMGRMISLVSGAIFKYIDYHSRKLKLTNSQYEVLEYLLSRGTQETNQKDIEKHMELANSTVSGILRRMEKRGLITRVPSPTIPTAKNVNMTEKARINAARVMNKVTEIEDLLVSDITSEDLEICYTVLQKIYKNVKTQLISQALES